jgi:hypothetical protein
VIVSWGGAHDDVATPRRMGIRAPSSAWESSGTVASPSLDETDGPDQQGQGTGHPRRVDLRDGRGIEELLPIPTPGLGPVRGPSGRTEVIVEATDTPLT